jgi:very-short-patch-repair endonuclease
MIFTDKKPLPLGRGSSLIECDGIYFHSRPSYIKRDKRKTTYLENNHYLVMRFTDIEIKNNFQNVISSLLNVVDI